MSDVFILGAGFSRALSQHMPLLTDLSQALAEEPGGPAELFETSAFRDDFELLLTYLSQKHPWESESEALRHRSQFLVCQERLAEIITAAEERAFLEPPPAWYHQLVEYWCEVGAVAITLNYDTLIERAPRLQEWAGGPYLYGVPVGYPLARLAGVYSNSTPAPFALLKLHGSVHWYYSGSFEFAGEQLYAVPLGPAGEPHRFAVSDKVPFIVPPVADKSSLYSNETLRTIWRLAAEALREADRVFCIGYSMPPTDLTIRYLMSACLPKRPVDFFVVNLATDEAARDGVLRAYHQALPDQHYRLDGKFLLPSDPVPAFVEWLCGEAKPPTAPPGP